MTRCVANHNVATPHRDTGTNRFLTPSRSRAPPPSQPAPPPSQPAPQLASQSWGQMSPITHNFITGVDEWGNMSDEEVQTEIWEMLYAIRSLLTDPPYQAMNAGLAELQRRQQRRQRLAPPPAPAPIAPPAQVRSPTINITT